MSTSYAPPVQRLVTELSKLPGVGNRTAQRLAFHLLRASDEDANALAEAIVEVKERIGLCEICFNLTDEPRCRICQDTRRDHALVCVVEEPSDVIPMERTHEYHGVYHVLGGALSPIDGIDPEDLKIAELLARVTPADADEPLREVVLATNPTTTGEATALHIAEELRRSAPAVDGHSPRERPAGGLGPRVRRRGHARQGSRRAPGCVILGSMTGVICMKFGGTSVADAERIKRAARRIVEKREAGYGVVAVLSARGKTTDELIAHGRRRSRRSRTRARWTCCSQLGRADLLRALRDGDQRPRPSRDLADGLAGRHRHRRVPHQGADPRRARRSHPSGARRGPDRARRRLPGRVADRART